MSLAQKRILVWYTDGFKTDEGTSAGVYRWGLEKGHSVSPGFHTTIIQAELYAIKACIKGDIEKGYKDRNIYILLNIQVAIKVLNNFQINSKLLWNCHQFLLKLAEHNRVQLVWVPGHMRIDGIPKESSSHPLRGPELSLGISAKVARGVNGDWTNRKDKEHLQSICEQRQAKCFLKNHLVEELENCSV